MVNSVLVSILVLYLLGVEEGLCIRCFSCISKDNKDECSRLDKSIVPLKKCDTTELLNTRNHSRAIDDSVSKLFEVDLGMQDPQVPMNCLKQVTKAGDKEFVLRGCQLAAADQLDICVKVKKENKDTLRTTYCSLCNMEGCNSAAWTCPSFLWFSVVIILNLYLITF